MPYIAEPDTNVKRHLGRVPHNGVDDVRLLTDFSGRRSLPSIREAARLLGGEATGGKVICPGPGHSRKDRSLSVLFSEHLPDGFVVRSFAGDDDLTCKDYVRGRLGLPMRDWRKPIPRDLPRRQPQHATDDQAGRIKAGLAIWQGARSIRGTPAEAYLASRGLRLDEDLSHILRFSAVLKLGGEPAIGMVALYRDALTNEPCGIHRTFLHPDGRPVLNADGQKIRKMLGRAKGAAIKLHEHEEVGCGLHIGEGIETCLSARILGYRPTWALGSSGAIADFPVIAGIEAITVLAENDAASNRAAKACRATYEAAGCESWICRPPYGDMNDLLRSVA
jgi:hypothetical protein